MDEIRKRINELNALQNKQQAQWFVCDDCARLCLYDDMKRVETYLATSKWGYERPFCDDCQRYCESCKESYCQEMAYEHEECPERDCECDKCRSIHNDQTYRRWYVSGYAEGEGWWVSNAPLDCIKMEECNLTTYMSNEQTQSNCKLTNWLNLAK